MKPDWARVVIPVIILMAGVAGFFALGKKAKERTQEAGRATVPEVEVVTVRPHRGHLEIGVNGQVVPFQEITLSAEVAGRVVYKAEQARAGRFAAKDTELVRIDDRDYTLAVKQLQNQLEQADVSVQELDEEVAGAQRLVDLGKDQLALSQNDYDRQAELYRRGVSSDAERDQARRDVINSENALTTIRNQLSLLKTGRSRLEQAQELTALQKEKAEHDLARTKILAPIDGVIVSDAVEQGDYVKPGTALLTIEDTSAVEVKCSLQMDELFWIWDQAAALGTAEQSDKASREYHIPRTPASVVYHLQGEDYLWDGELWRIEGVGLDERTRTVPCRVIVRNPREVWFREGNKRRKSEGGPPALVRGMYVDVAIRAQPKTRLFRMPEKAIRPGEVIWVARPVKADVSSDASSQANSTAHALHIINVDVVEVIDNDAVVRADLDELAEGDLVVVSPLAMRKASSDDAAEKERTIPVRVKMEGANEVE